MRRLIFLLSLLAGCEPPAPSTPPPPKADPPLQLTTIELLDRYVRDEFAADRDLDGKAAELTGAVASVDAKAGRIILDVPFRRPAGGFEGAGDAWDRIAAAAVNGPLPLASVLCAFPGNRNDLSKIHPGQTVTVRGVLRARDKLRTVVLQDSSVAKVR